MRFIPTIPRPKAVAFLEVTLAATGESIQIGFFPGGPFRSESRAEAQRFFLPWPEGSAAAELCYRVALRTVCSA